MFLIGLSSSAQVPNYVPTDGLVAWYPFNGNANDESGNGNNGTVNGATLTEDRNGNIVSAYYFSSSSCDTRVDAIVNTVSIQSGLTISLWVNKLGDGCINPRVFEFYSGSGGPTDAFMIWSNNGTTDFGSITSTNTFVSTSFLPEPNNVWFNLVYTNDGLNGKFYKNGILFHTESSSGTVSLNGNLAIGRMNHPSFDAFNGKIDDFGIWNRALTEQEIQALYIGCNVAPTTIAGSVNPFTLTSSNYACNNNPGSTYEWTITNGVITAGQGTSNVTVLWGEEGAGTLTVLETNTEGCSGTPATIEVTIECATTATTLDGPLGPNALTETTYTCNGSANSTYQWTISNGVITSGQGTNSVTVLWAGTGLGALSVQETTNANCDGEIISLDVVVIPTSIEEFIKQSIQLFPNPTSDHITVDFGSVVKLNGYTLSIFNPMGQLVYDSNITTQIENFDVNTWGAKGVYQVVVYNPQGVPIETRQIVLQ